MKFRNLTAAFALVAAVHAAPPPNIIFILCDDLGFGDTGPTFQNERAALHDRAVPAFSTPHLDRVAAEGTLLRNHYCGAPVCAPSRASILLGLTQGHANVRDNQFDKKLEDNHTLATVLKAAGYSTAAIGKWGLQGRADGKADVGAEEGQLELPGGNAKSWPAFPTKRGFEFYYGYIRHVDGHFHYPKEDHREVWENNQEVSAGLAGCYTTDLFTARAKKWIIDQHAGQPNRPFFLYLAYDTPHAKLQLPPCAYPAGAGLHGGLQWLGKPGKMINTADGKMDGWMDPAVANETWDDDHNPNTPEKPWPDVQRRYATDVRRIDAAVGDLMQLLRDLQIDENTLVVFTSDNGPSKESYIKSEPYDPNFFHGFGPFDGIKRDNLEGGVREPTFVRWPGKVRANRVDRTPCGQWDWLATFADAAGIAAPAESDGVSLLPTLTGQGTQRRSALYLEYYNQQRTPNYPEFTPANRGRVRRQMQTLMVDGYIGMRYDIKSANDDFEIYDVEKDPQEAHNLAGNPAFAAVQARMKARALQARRPDPGAARPYDAAPVPPAEATNIVSGKIGFGVYAGKWPWVPDFRTLTATKTGVAEKIDLHPCPATDDVGMAFVGFFRAPTAGDYVFAVTSDGGAELFLHDARVIDDDFARTGAEVSGTIRLAAGWHPIRLYYRHATGAQKLAVTVQSPGGIPRPVDATDLGSQPRAVR